MAETAASETAQKKALRKYRTGLAQRGFARFEVMAPESDRELIRALARKLAADRSEAAQVRTAVQKLVADEESTKGAILAALLRSPLVGSEIEFSRSRDEGRIVDL